MYSRTLTMSPDEATNVVDVRVVHPCHTQIICTMQL